ncbi:galactokinase [Bacillaceae bacterium IKA-2]|nr:galactokinase [Bacillaceae bacterium IKA-2]
MNHLQSLFTEIFNKSEKELRRFFAPGRVNLIGEHIDYNGGYVLPCALDIGTYAVVSERVDNQINVYSNNFPEKGVVSFTLDELSFKAEHDWANYPKGVMKDFFDKGVMTSGLDIFFEGNIPNGAGLSSSASIELVTAVLLNEVFQANEEMIDLVKLSQKVENEFIGVKCGIMDQFAVGMGKDQHAILLHCDTLDYKYLQLDLKDSSIVIANTNKKRGLADSAYNERRTTCEIALAKIKEKVSSAIVTLANLTVEEFEQSKAFLTETEQKRVLHVVSENIRTKQAALSLQNGNLNEFGLLMKQSHESLRDLYEVTGIELDTLVEAAWKHKGTIGARMTGAGFGGCTVNIVKNAEIRDFIEKVGNEYNEKIGYMPSFYTATIGEGAKELTESEVI